MQFGVHDGAGRYQETLVPLMFAPSARRLVADAALPSGAHVLDVATGTGVVARTAAHAVGPGGRVVAIDLAAGMLAVARSQPSLPSSAAIEFIESAIETAQLPAHAFHAVFCQQGVQFFDDPLTALLHMRQALATDGCLHIALWCALEQHPLAASIQRALVESGLGELTSFLARAHRLHDTAGVRALLGQAGFILERVSEVEITPDGEWQASDGRRLLAATPLAQQLAALSVEQRRSLEDACERQFDAHTRHGILELHFPATFYTARPATVDSR